VLFRTHSVLQISLNRNLILICASSLSSVYRKGEKKSINENLQYIRTTRNDEWFKKVDVHTRSALQATVGLTTIKKNMIMNLADKNI
jgi:hypothetical protein